MKNLFYGYYTPTEDQFKQLWKSAFFVLDTNVLLSFYRVHGAQREQLFDVLEALKDRLWIPHQVALEYQRNRLNVITQVKKQINDVSNDIRDSVEKIGIQLKLLDKLIDKEGVLDQFKQGGIEVGQILKEVLESQVKENSIDPIRERLDMLFDGKVGISYSQNELEKIVTESKSRFENKIPPGYNDSDKSHDYHFDGVRFEAKVGDLILWKQIIDKAKAEKIKQIVLVTSDLKDDWWRLESGKTVGPQPELMREIFREAGVELFWIYKTDRFYEYAGGYLKDVKVSDDTVREIRSVMEDSMYRYMRNYFFKNTNSNESLANNWLNEYVGETHPTTENGIYAISEKNGKQSVVIFCEFKTDYYFEFLNLQKKVDLVFGTSEADKRGLIVIFIVEDYDYFDEYEMKKILNISSKVKFNSPINIIVGGIIGDVFSPIYSNYHLDS